MPLPWSGPHRHSRPSVLAAAQVIECGWASWRDSVWTPKLSVSAHCFAKKSDVHPVPPLVQAAALVAVTVMAVVVEPGLVRGAAGSRHVL